MESNITLIRNLVEDNKTYKHVMAKFVTEIVAGRSFKTFSRCLTFTYLVCAILMSKWRWKRCHWFSGRPMIFKSDCQEMAGVNYK